MKNLDDAQRKLLREMAESAQPGLGVAVDLVKLREYVLSRAKKRTEEAASSSAAAAGEAPSKRR